MCSRPPRLSRRPQIVVMQDLQQRLGHAPGIWDGPGACQLPGSRRSCSPRRSRRRAGRWPSSRTALGWGSMSSARSRRRRRRRPPQGCSLGSRPRCVWRAPRRGRVLAAHGQDLHVRLAAEHLLERVAHERPASVVACPAGTSRRSGEVGRSIPVVAGWYRPRSAVNGIVHDASDMATQQSVRSQSPMTTGAGRYRGRLGPRDRSSPIGWNHAS